VPKIAGENVSSVTQISRNQRVLRGLRALFGLVR